MVFTCSIETYRDIQKSLTGYALLKYFKNKLINHLKNQEKSELKKSIDFIENTYTGRITSLIDIEKGRAANIGDVHTWNGRKFRKIAPGKWKPIYESESRGAKQSIRILSKKIQNAQTIDELFEIVMQNTNRFTDENGKLLPIVEELKKAVNESKSRLNAGKPSTKEQIEKFKKENEQNFSDITISIDDFPSQCKRGKWKKEMEGLIDEINVSKNPNKSVIYLLKNLKENIDLQLETMKKRRKNIVLSML